MICFFQAGRPNPRRKPLKPAHFFFWRTSPQNFSGAGRTFFRGAERRASLELLALWARRLHEHALLDALAHRRPPPGKAEPYPGLYVDGA